MNKPLLFSCIKGFILVFNPSTEYDVDFIYNNKYK